MAFERFMVIVLVFTLEKLILPFYSLSKPESFRNLRYSGPFTREQLSSPDDPKHRWDQKSQLPMVLRGNVASLQLMRLFNKGARLHPHSIIPFTTSKSRDSLVAKALQQDKTTRQPAAHKGINTVKNENQVSTYKKLKLEA
ncbi:hypothetical protein QQP08_006722 [Theobroma cacao]|nr:hypothetical protein QQP08_006722 [Theobroma cacao]